MQKQLALLDRVEANGYTGTVIYETAGRAREYRELACNHYSGCDHLCGYCYAPKALQRRPEDFHGRARPRQDILRKLAKDAAGYGRAGETRQVLFSFATDPYCHADVEHRLTRQGIQICHEHGLAVCVLTKGGSRSLRDLDLFGPRDSYACTLTSLDPAMSRKWEPAAALPEDRIAALAAFHAAGIPRWVSLEPVLDPRATLDIISHTANVVDEYKVGKLNYVQNGTDWRRFAQDAVELLEGLGKQYYLKRDLREHLS